MTTVNNAYLLSLFGNSSSTSTNLFSALYPQTSSSTSSGSTSAVTTSINTPAPPIPPWLSSSTAPQQAALVTNALARQPLINANAITLNTNTPQNDDYRNLFAIYQGLNALDGLATDASKSGLSPTQLTQYANAFQTGLSQVISYVGSTKFDNLTLAAGATSNSQTSTAGVSTAANSNQYVGQNLYVGDASQPVPAFEGDVEFSLTAKKLNGPTVQVEFNLNDMNSTPRTLANVLAYLNGKLADAGVDTRFADKQTIAAPNTITVNGKTVTLPDAPTQYALTLNTSSLETVSLGAPSTADAVYVSQSATSVTTGAATKTVMGTTTSTTDNVTTTTTGSTTTTTTVAQQLLKFQTDNSTTGTPPPDTAPRPGDANSVAGRSWSETLASATTSALATATGPDGSVYVLTNVDDSVAGQALAGQSDVALMKYDSTGKLIYTRTLGASTSAQGLSLAVSSTGQIAIAGSVTGDLTGTDVGELQSTVNGVNQTATNAAGTPDSFVSLLDANGNELWTQSGGGVQANQANAVAFSADGSQVYVAGKTQSPMQGGGQEQGGWDGYLQGFDATTGKREFTQQFGTTGSDSATSIAVNGNSVLVGGVDNGDAVVRAFDVTTPTAVTMTASQDLGNLQGGNVVGLGIDGNGNVIVAGTANNVALGSGVASAVNSAPAGSNVFVASLNASLTSTSGNTIAWYGGSGNDAATAMTLANGQVYVAGKTTADLPGTTAIGKQDGFVAAIDPSTGAATWTERFSGPGGNVAPQSIAVASNGASVLDRLGLPSGTLQMGDTSNLVTSATSLRAGDKFTVAANGGPAVTVTIEADDTMQTLAKKIARASGSNATVQVLSNGSVSQLNIKPFLQNSTITLGQGPAGEDALGPLGLKAGVIADTPSSSSSSSSTKPLSGLNLTTSLNLSSTASIATAKNVLDQALSTIKLAYLKLENLDQPKSNPAAASASGPVPTYISNEISNYQAALLRLTGQA